MISKKANWHGLGGKLNVCENCVDRHVEQRGDQVAILWEGDEPGDVRRITYRELQRMVCRLANVLRHHNIRKGDRVAIYMPMIPEAAAAMPWPAHALVRCTALFLPALAQRPCATASTIAPAWR